MRLERVSSGGGRRGAPREEDSNQVRRSSHPALVALVTFKLSWPCFGDVSSALCCVHVRIIFWSKARSCTCRPCIQHVQFL